jgi:hypothetical protein
VTPARAGGAAVIEVTEFAPGHVDPNFATLAMGTM